GVFSLRQPHRCPRRCEFWRVGTVVSDGLTITHRQSEFFRECLEVGDDLLIEGYSALRTLCCRFPFRVSRDQNAFLPRDGFGRAESLDPVVHVVFELRCRTESIDTHRAEEMTDALAYRVGFGF